MHTSYTYIINRCYINEAKGDDKRNEENIAHKQKS